jgi:hypothetical protein
LYWLYRVIGLGVIVIALSLFVYLQVKGI